MGSKVEQLENESDDPHIECYKHNSFLFQFDKNNYKTNVEE